MPHHHIRDLWKETLSARPASKDAYRGMHMAFLRRAERVQSAEHLAFLPFGTGDFLLCESKGNPPVARLFTRPPSAAETLWLCFQLQGLSTLP